jgi:hypothetical protein
VLSEVSLSKFTDVAAQCGQTHNEALELSNASHGAHETKDMFGWTVAVKKAAS